MGEKKKKGGKERKKKIKGKKEGRNNLEKMLIQGETLIDLLFMKEISQLVNFCSKSFQQFDVLPFYVVSVLSDIKCNIIRAKLSVESGCPENVKISFQNSPEYVVWDLFNSSVQQICATQQFKYVPLLITEESVFGRFPMYY